MLVRHCRLLGEIGGAGGAGGNRRGPGGNRRGAGGQRGRGTPGPRLNHWWWLVEACGWLHWVLLLRNCKKRFVFSQIEYKQTIMLFECFFEGKRCRRRRKKNEKNGVCSRFTACTRFIRPSILDFQRISIAIVISLYVRPNSKWPFWG